MGDARTDALTVGRLNDLVRVVGFATEDDLSEEQRSDREVLFRLAGELEALATQTDAAGRAEGPGLRLDAAVLRRIAADKGNVVTVRSPASS